MEELGKVVNGPDVAVGQVSSQRRNLKLDVCLEEKVKYKVFNKKICSELSAVHFV